MTSIRCVHSTAVPRQTLTSITRALITRKKASDEFTHLQSRRTTLASATTTRSAWTDKSSTRAHNHIERQVLVAGSERTERRRALWVLLRSKIQKYSRCLCLMLVLFIYTITGGAIFQAIESPNEDDSMKKRTDYLQTFIGQLCATVQSPLSACNVEVDKLLYENQNFLSLLYEHGVNSTTRRWTLSGASFFAITTYTTVGYGQISPKTTGGRVATIIYGTIGVPLFMYVIAILGSFMNCRLRRLWAYIIRAKTALRSRLYGLPISAKGCGIDTLCRKRSKKPIPIYLAVGAMYSYIVVGAAIFMVVEKDWSYFTAFYFCFQTLYTVGFGDVMPKYANYLWFSLYMVAGLAMVSMCVAAIQEHLKQLYERELPATIWALPAAVQNLHKDIGESLQKLGRQVRSGSAPAGQMSHEVGTSEKIEGSNPSVQE